jgi:chromosome partitioning protein
MATKTIALIASKGGSGKSTLAAVLATRAAQESKKVALIDLEPQQSLATWWRLRGQPDNPKLHESCGDIGDDITDLEEARWQWVIIDTPPAMMSRIEAAIKAADFCLIPVRSSIFDVAAIKAVVDLCQDNNKPYAFVMNAVDPKWGKLVTSSIAALKQFGPVLEGQLRYRSAYTAALNTGESAAEHRKDAAEEVDALWSEIKSMM